MLDNRTIRVFALPFAGGNKFSYRPLENVLPVQIEWSTLELPGRGDRMKEQCLVDVPSMVDVLFQQLSYRIKRSDYMIYGHSMGALLGYELTQKIVHAGLAPPVCLYLTGKAAPYLAEKNKIADFASRDFWQAVRKLGGLPQEIFGDDELMALFEPILRTDFRAVEQYRYNKMNKPLALPLFVGVGDQEDITPEEVMQWQQETTDFFASQTFPGDHFFIFNEPEILVKKILQAYWQSSHSKHPDNELTPTL